VLAGTRNAVQRSGNSWQEYGQQIQDVLKQQSDLSAFDDEDLSQTFANLVRRTGNVNEALRLNALAANVARGRNISLASAANLVLKASIGQAGALRRLGIEAKKGATATQLLDLLQRKYAGAAEAYSNTAAGSIDRLRVQIENTEEVIATAFLPTVTKASKALADWLGQPSNQKRIQTDAKKTGDVFSAIADRLGDAKDTVDSIFNFSGPPPWWQNWADDVDRRLNNWKAGLEIFGVDVFRNKPQLDRAGGGDFPTSPRPDNRAGPFGPGSSGSGIPGKVSGRIRVSPVTSALPFRQFQLAVAAATKQRKDDEQVLRVIVAALQERLGKAKTLKAKTEIVTAINQYQGQLSGLLDQDAQDVKDAAEKVKQARERRVTQRNSFFDARIARDLDQIQDLRAPARQLEALAKVAVQLRERIAATGDVTRKLNLGDQLRGVVRDQRAIRDARAEAATAAASQFTTPLRLQIAAVRASITSGKDDDRAVALKVAAAARKALKSGRLLLDGQLDAWNTLADALANVDKKSGTGTLFHKESVSKLTANLGLSADKRRELEGRLSRRGPGGQVAGTGTGAFGRPIVVHSHVDVHLDKQKVGTAVTKTQQTRARRNPPQKRGPHGI
jgi:hypothetical protein